METKLSFVVEAMQAGDHRKAVSLAARFPSLCEQRSAILDAQMAVTNPAFARQLGKDPDALIIAGVAAIRAKYAI